MDLSIIGHILGSSGMILICVAYWLVTTQRYKPTSNHILRTNLIGAVLLTISLLINFNLGSFLIEVFWIIISVQGLYRNWKDERR